MGTTSTRVSSQAPKAVPFPLRRASWPSAASKLKASCHNRSTVSEGQKAIGESARISTPAAAAWTASPAAVIWFGVTSVGSAKTAIAAPAVRLTYPEKNSRSFLGEPATRARTRST